MPKGGSAIPTELLLSVGGIAGLLSLDSFPRLLPHLRDRYDPFLLPASPRCDLSWSLQLGERPGSKMAGGLGPAPEVRAWDRRIEVRRRDFEACWHRSSRGGRPMWTGEGRCVFHPASADALLRAFLSVLFRRSGGALFHSAAVRIGGAGILFPGISGAGKTTIAGKAGDAETTLSDELTPVRREAAGRWRIYGSPFWGGYAKGGPSPRGWPLALVAFPRKGMHSAVSPLSPAETAQRLLATLLCYESGEPVAREALSYATRLAADVPGIELTTARATRPDTVRRALRSCLAATGIEEDPPAARRERIAELRIRLERDGVGAFVATGDSMRPTIRPGDTVFVETAGADDARAGDLLLHWQPGRGPDDDLLVCHRAVGRFGGGGARTLLTKGDNAGSFERFTDGREAAVIGRVVSVHRDGTAKPVAGRACRLTRLAGSLIALPLQRLRERAGIRSRR